MLIAVATSAATCCVAHLVGGICGIDVFERRDGYAFKFLGLELDKPAGVDASPGHADVPAQPDQYCRKLPLA
jgi:hypothetical protein